MSISAVRIPDPDAISRARKQLEEARRGMVDIEKTLEVLDRRERWHDRQSTIGMGVAKWSWLPIAAGVVASPWLPTVAGWSVAAGLTGFVGGFGYFFYQGVREMSVAQCHGELATQRDWQTYHVKVAADQLASAEKALQDYEEKRQRDRDALSRVAAAAGQPLGGNVLSHEDFCTINEVRVPKHI